MNDKFSLKIKLGNHVELSTYGAVIHLPLKAVHKLQLYYSTTCKHNIYQKNRTTLIL